MDFELSAEQEKIRERAADFAKDEINPVLEEISSSKLFPESIIRKLGKGGFLGLGIPEEYRGTGTDGISRILAIEEISKVSPSAGLLLLTHTGLGVTPILLFGSDSLKRHYLPRLAKGKMLSSFALSEPEAGSDVAGLQAKATKDGGAYSLVGQKTFVTLGGIAEVYTVFAKTDADKGSRGISGFAVPRDAEGFSVGRSHTFPGIENLGIVELSLNSCEVPENNLLGEEGEGFKIAMQSIDYGRLGVAAMAIGIAQNAADSAINHALRREQFGKPLSNMEIIQEKLADVATTIEGARLNLYRAAYLQTMGEGFTKEASMAKLSASRAAVNSVLESAQIHAGRANFNMLPVAKLTEIMGGTSEIQRLVIAKNLFKRK